MSALPKRVVAISVLCALCMLSGCSFAPAYHPPLVHISNDAWTDTPWPTATPADDQPRGDWWQVYADPTLTALEGRIAQDNPDLAVALARYDQANAYTQQLSAGLLPSLDAGASATKNRQSDNRPLRGSGQPDVYSANTIGLGTNYELDFWGKVRNQVAAGKAAAQASAADVENVRLSLQAKLAENYVALRGVDIEAKLLNDAVYAYQLAKSLTQHRHDGGISSGLDVARAETQLRTARAQAANIDARRALYVHAIASLVGEPAMNFSLPVMKTRLNVPEIPLGVPSVLLQRRPDIAAAERRVAAANAKIGVARAAYFPDFSIGAGYGYQNTGASNFLTAPNSFWTFGPSVIFNLFDAGLRDAQLAQARAAMDQAAAQYRATALAAFQQVQDDLSQLKFDKLGEREQNAAVSAAEKTLELAMNRYREGAVNYLEVVTAQTEVLTAQRSALDLHTRRLQSSVDLIRALGGGWTTAVR